MEVLIDRARLAAWSAALFSPRNRPRCLNGRGDCRAAAEESSSRLPARTRL